MVTNLSLFTALQSYVFFISTEEPQIVHIWKLNRQFCH